MPIFFAAWSFRSFFWKLFEKHLCNRAGWGVRALARVSIAVLRPEHAPLVGIPSMLLLLLAAVLPNRVAYDGGVEVRTAASALYVYLLTAIV